MPFALNITYELLPTVIHFTALHFKKHYTGALLAIPSSIAPTLRIQTVPGAKIRDALVQYGGYVSRFHETLCCAACEHKLTSLFLFPISQSCVCAHVCVCVCVCVCVYTCVLNCIARLVSFTLFAH